MCITCWQNTCDTGHPVPSRGVREHVLYFWFPNCCLPEWPRPANVSSNLCPSPGVPARIRSSLPLLLWDVIKELHSPIWAAAQVTCILCRLATKPSLSCSRRLISPFPHWWGHQPEKPLMSDWSSIPGWDFTWVKNKCHRLRHEDVGVYPLKQEALW